LKSQEKFDLVVVGGGAAGYMGAITAAEEGVAAVLVLELSIKTLEKVLISGGGRCNVTNACWDPSDLVTHYPRGKKSLFGAFSRFAAGDAVDWFNRRGLELIIEDDGRLFPRSNSSKDVVSCLKESASKCGVICLTKKSVIDIKVLSNGNFILHCKDGSSFYTKTVLLATGGSLSGKKLALQLGHKLIPSVPSLFSFRINSSWMQSCAGIAVENVKIKLFIENKIFTEQGIVLITHKGLSGPAILRLSAFAARELYYNKYKATIEINWLNNTNESIKDLLSQYRISYSNRSLNRINPFENLPKRLWVSFLNQNDISSKKNWSSFSRVDENRLSEFLCRNSHKLIGKGPFGDEFVTAGGVALEEVNFQTMRSKITNNLFFAGEVLDIDGVTGGFNFQHCWTSGWIAGRAISKDLDK
tara:strand:- start:1740 stop:2984 length:1245 start_codon:yes stop_codon:yes gene_type:complete